MRGRKHLDGRRITPRQDGRTTKRMRDLTPVKLSQIDLNLLVVLDAIVTERSVTEAGHRIGLSQSAVSAALRRLRDLFNDPLLERSGARWQLTPLALELADPVRQILAAIDTAVNGRNTFDPSTSHRRFRIAAADDVSCVLVQPVLERLATVAPHVRVLVVRPDNETGERLATRQLDLSIEPNGRYRSQGFSSQRVYRDHWVVGTWQGNTQVGERLSYEQFLELGHVSVSVRPYALTLVERVVGGLTQKLDVQVVSESFTALALLLRGTQRIALIPGRMAAMLKDVAQIRLLHPPLPLDDLVFAMAWPSLWDRDEGHVWLRSLIAEVASELEDAGGEHTRNRAQTSS
jgi:LysR family transcriptional regulator, nod-box dependent transcriptional activator